MLNDSREKPFTVRQKVIPCLACAFAESFNKNTMFFSLFYRVLSEDLVTAVASISVWKNAVDVMRWCNAGLSLYPCVLCSLNEVFYPMLGSGDVYRD